jgi:hypothetical protein
MRRLILSFVFSLFALSAWAEPLALRLEAFVVERDLSTGEERFVAAESASPGAIIEYRASYENTTATLLDGIKPEIPVPEGLDFLVGSDRPSATALKLQGSGAFVTAPALDSEGRPVAPELIRALRWSIAPLPPGQSAVIVMRAQVRR